MDLKRISAATRDELEDEARRRGIDVGDGVERDELESQILAHEKRSAGGVVDAARSLLGRVVDMALGARRPEDRPPPPSATPPRRASTPPAAPSSPPVAAAPTPSPAPAPTPTAEPASEAATQSPMSAEPASTEPIRTRTMARLLAEQGHPARARAIYDELLASDPKDDELRAERDTLTSTAPRTPASAPDGTFEFDAISTVGIDATSALVAWEITEAGVERARGVLGDDGELTLRVVTIAADAQQIVRARSTDHAPVQRTGHQVATDLPPHATCFAAIGMRAGERFVAIAHAAGVRTAPGEPVPQIATDYVRVPSAAELFPVARAAAPVPSTVPATGERSAEALRASAAAVDALTAQPDVAVIGGASEQSLPSSARIGASERARPSGGPGSAAELVGASGGRGARGGASERARPSGSPPSGGSRRR